MREDRFRAFVVHREEKRTVGRIETVTENDLPDGDILIEVDHSSLNYKDGLAVTGRAKVIRHFPMVPGIDLAGTVIESESESIRIGDRILATGWGLGEHSWGGYAERARISSEWLLPLPEQLDTRRAMAIGTAGFTAMLCVMRLEDAGILPGRDPIVVTGAGGGVGSLAIAILASHGCKVTAVTGRPEIHDSLRQLGASEIVERAAMEEPPQPLEKQRWAGAIDTVGGRILGRILAETEYGGAVVACGLAGGADLPTNVMPFILRAIALLGVESVTCPVERRRIAWSRLAQNLPIEKLDRITQQARLEDIPTLAERILTGQIHGRVVISPRP